MNTERIASLIYWDIKQKRTNLDKIKNTIPEKCFSIIQNIWQVIEVLNYTSPHEVKEYLEYLLSETDEHTIASALDIYYKARHREHQKNLFQTSK